MPESCARRPSVSSESIALFEINAESYPANANAQFHCGEVFRYAGSPGRAAEQYRKALALDPDHVNAAARLAEIGPTG